MTVSVIIPTLNEAVCLPETLRRLRLQNPHEILVSDGGSTDATCEIAQAADQVIVGARGRAAQMNHAAAKATGDVLFFLHADCWPEDDALSAAESLLGRRGIAAGCLRMTVADRRLIYRAIDFCATVRVRLTGLIYGDQGLFVQRRLFERIGGFPAVRLMEDVFISRALRRHGRIVVAPQRIFVSPRRWKKQGVVRQTLRNWTLTALAVAGVHPDRLAVFYPMVR
jgi:rSAM/selenodomain-associated transferase 2